MGKVEKNGDIKCHCDEIGSDSWGRDMRGQTEGMGDGDEVKGAAYVSGGKGCGERGELMRGGGRKGEQEEGCNDDGDDSEGSS